MTLTQICCLIALTVVLPIVYGLIVGAVRNEISDSIDNYYFHSGFNYGYYNEKIERLLKHYKKELSNIGGILWPFFIAFIIGAKIGGRIHFKLTKNNYEDRIGAWFI